MKHYAKVTGQNYDPPSKKHFRWECSCGAHGPFQRTWRQAWDGQKWHLRMVEIGDKLEQVPFKRIGDYVAIKRDHYEQLLHVEEAAKRALYELSDPAPDLYVLTVATNTLRSVFGDGEEKVQHKCGPGGCSAPVPFNGGRDE